MKTPFNSFRKGAAISIMAVWAGCALLTIWSVRAQSLRTIYDFTATVGPSYTNSDGIYPNGALVLSGSRLYGTANDGGTWKNGTVFRFTLPITAPWLTIIPYSTDVILVWSTNAAGFGLQVTTNLTATAVWSPVPQGPVVIGNDDVVIETIAGPARFYRLRSK
jgi:hypothetical protein